MAKRRYVGNVFGVCSLCGETHMPLTYYKRTKEWLDDSCLAHRKNEPIAKKYVDTLEKGKDFRTTMMS